jgi:hypothetical protein
MAEAAAATADPFEGLDEPTQSTTASADPFEGLDEPSETHRVQDVASGLASGAVTAIPALTVDAARNAAELNKIPLGMAYSTLTGHTDRPKNETPDTSGRAGTTPGGLKHYTQYEIGDRGIQQTEVYRGAPFRNPDGSIDKERTAAQDNSVPVNAKPTSRFVPGDIPDLLQAEKDEDYKKDIGSSDWVLDQIRGLNGKNWVDAKDDDTLGKYLHMAGQGAAGGAGGEGVLVASEARNAARFGPEVVKDVLKEGALKDAPIAGAAGAAAGVAQQGVADLTESQGIDPNSSAGRTLQTVAGVLAGEKVAGRLHRAAEPKAPPPASPPVDRPGGITAQDLIDKDKARQAAARQAAEAAAKKAAPTPPASVEPETAPKAATVIPHKDGFAVKTGDGNVVSTHPTQEAADATAKAINDFHAQRTGGAPAGPNQNVRDVAREYANDQGMTYEPPDDQRAIDPKKAAAIAQEYETMEHNPSDPLVAASYEALKRETLAQYQAMKRAGVKVDFIDPAKPDPYGGNPRGVIDDIRDNNHLWVYPTDAGFGTESAPHEDHPMLEDSGETISGRPALHNDIFRAVHGYFGHAAEGNGFRENGEYNAWRNHNALYSDAARPALATETLGQNAWVNRGPHGDTNRTASQADTVYADQKAGLMPPHTYEGNGGEPASGRVTAQNGQGITAGNRPFSIISADRDNRTPGENAAHRTQLERQLKDLGAEHVPTEVVYKGGPPEKSLVVYHDTPETKSQIEALAAKHDQDSVLHVDEHRDGVFRYGDGTQQQIGKLRPTDQKTAEASEGFTRDADGNHYILQPDEEGPRQYGQPPTQDGTPPPSAREKGATDTPESNPLAWMHEPVNPNNVVKLVKPEDEGTMHGAVSPEQQHAREAAIRSLGLTETRRSAITGNTTDTGTDWATARVKGKGDRLAQVIQAENDALVRGVDKLHDMAGGTSGTDNTSMYTRGNAHVDAIDSYNAELQRQKQAQYDEADAKMGGKPLPALNTFENYLKENKAQFLMSSDGKQLLEGTNALLKQMGFHGKNDTFNPPTVQQVEALRQELGKAWTPRTSRFIGEMKDALDEDVAKATGESAYAKARALNTLQSKMLKEPKLVNAIRTPDGGDSLQRASSASVEKLPTMISSAPVDQFSHYVNVLEQMGAGGEKNPELAAKAATAINEIRGQFINEYKKAGLDAQGRWNARLGNEYLERNNLKMSMVFPPEQMRQIKMHNDAAAALKMDKSYPGAAVQSHNLLSALGGKAAKAVGEAVGAGSGGMMGYLAAKGVEGIAGKALGNVESRSIESRIAKLDKPQKPLNAKPNIKKAVGDAAENINGYASGSDSDAIKNGVADAAGQINAFAEGSKSQRLKIAEKSAGANAVANVAANAQGGEADAGEGEEAAGLLSAERALGGTAATQQQQQQGEGGILGNALKPKK